LTQRVEELMKEIEKREKVIGEKEGEIKKMEKRVVEAEERSE
jgi:predicted  nucleic acid-binding Zn-ribbon protein